jgi:hypothetical protein
VPLDLHVEIVAAFEPPLIEPHIDARGLERGAKFFSRRSVGS